VAKYLQTVLDDILMLPQGETLFDDVPMTEKIMGRFDLPRKDTEFHQYGYKGVSNLRFDLDSGRLKEGVTKEQARQRAYNLLRERFDKYFTDGFSYSEHRDRAQSSEPANQAMKVKQTPGGIDLTSDRMKLDVDSDSALKAAGQVMDLKALENIEINGLYIKSIDISPIKNLPELLGITSP